MPEHLFQSTEMAVTLARDNQIEVTPYVGTLVRTHPIELEAASGATAVRFVMSGGLGYTPLVIHGLARHDGWRLEQLRDDGETWQIVDQSVEGNDFWQAYQVLSRGDYDLIFNIHNRGTPSIPFGTRRQPLCRRLRRRRKSL